MFGVKELKEQIEEGEKNLGAAQAKIAALEIAVAELTQTVNSFASNIAAASQSASDAKVALHNAGLLP